MLNLAETVFASGKLFLKKAQVQNNFLHPTLGNRNRFQIHHIHPRYMYIVHISHTSLIHVFYTYITYTLDTCKLYIHHIHPRCMYIIHTSNTFSLQLRQVLVSYYLVTVGAVSTLILPFYSRGSF